MTATIKTIATSLLTLIAMCGIGGCSKHAESVSAGHSHEAPAADHHKEHAHQEHVHKEHSHKGGAYQHHAHHDNGAAPEAKVTVGEKVPDFTVRTQDGKRVRLSELQQDQRRTKQGLVVLAFWCSTCHSCRDVEQLLAKLCKEYEGQAAVYALDANADETPERVAAFLQKNSLEFPVVFDPAGSQADLFGVNKTTTTVVIDGQGVLRYCGQFQHAGGGSAEEAVKAILAGKEVAVKTTPHYG